MKISKFFAPYNADGKNNLLKFKNRTGVYIIKEKGSAKLLYIGYSGYNLYKTVTRHFQRWKDNTQVRTTR